jgi:hypothetical protein
MTKWGLWEGMVRRSGLEALIKVKNKTKNDFREIETIFLGGKIPQPAVNQNDDLTVRSALHGGDSRVKAPQNREMKFICR